MNRKRLEMLRDHLRKLKPSLHRKFDMSKWFGAEITTGLTEHGTLRADPKTGECRVEGICGTAACALGHAALMPEFQKMGLELRQQRDRVDWFRPRYNGKFDYNAGAAFFDISTKESVALFSPDAYKRTMHVNRDLEADPILPREVANRITRLLKGKDITN